MGRPRLSGKKKRLEFTIRRGHVAGKRTLKYLTTHESRQKRGLIKADYDRMRAWGAVLSESRQTGNEKQISSILEVYLIGSVSRERQFQPCFGSVGGESGLAASTSTVVRSPMKYEVWSMESPGGRLVCEGTLYEGGKVGATVTRVG